MPRKSLQTKLLNWYAKNKRTLPWRGHPDSYAVWVSEIMLQQTRVETVIPYFEKWMLLFPKIETLAKASEREVLNAWEGLGYYSRARNLHKAAGIVVKEHGGKLPRDIDSLIKLPGIGRYTVGAVASIAFGMDEPALDGNLKRVYARLFDVAEPTDSSVGEKQLWEIASESLPMGKAGDFNQALMDLGATICVPKNPRCDDCPVREFCKAQKNGTQALRPVRKPKKDAPHHIHAAGVIVQRGRVLLAQRPSKGLLGGMWEFPNGRVEQNPAKELTKILRSEYRLKVQRKEAWGIVQHAYTHFKVTVHVFRCNMLPASSSNNLMWVSATDLDDYPMGKVDRRIAQMVLEFLEHKRN
ncbi:MAG TPA: A/G-specific adenine glycosylase [Anaerolineales bacterium]|nr:A/G-specific adenine glycosylase [Anaerolineales bacterium]